MNFNQPPYSRRAIKSIANCLMQYNGYDRKKAKEFALWLAGEDKADWMARKSHKNPRRRGVYGYTIMVSDRDNVLFIQCGLNIKPTVFE